jgi:hypothetical protein
MSGFVAKWSPEQKAMARQMWDHPAVDVEAITTFLGCTAEQLKRLSEREGWDPRPGELRRARKQQREFAPDGVVLDEHDPKIVPGTTRFRCQECGRVSTWPACAHCCEVINPTFLPAFRSTEAA